MMEKKKSVWRTLPGSGKEKTAAGGGLEPRTAREAGLAGPEQDGRRRPNGRSVQFNLRVSPEFKAAIERIATAHKSSNAKVLEWLLEQHAIGGEATDSAEADRDAAGGAT